MKNRFFGDINDYRKYGLLRALAADGKTKIGVCWMLTQDSSRGGNEIEYLDSPTHYRPYDAKLFDYLLVSLKEKQQRSVRLIEESGLLPYAAFYSHSRPVPGGEVERQQYFEEMLSSFSDRTLVFFDPDKGIIPSERTGGNKQEYVCWSEVEEAFKRGFSVLIYQHFPRENHEEFIDRKTRELQGRTQAAAVYAFRTPKTVFFLAAHDNHIEDLRVGIQTVKERWGERDASRGPQIDVCEYHSTLLEMGSRPTTHDEIPNATLRAGSTSVYDRKPLRLDRVRTYPLASRLSKVCVADFAGVTRASATVRDWMNSLPRILAGESFRAVVAALERAREKRKPIIWGLGGHVIKCGLSPILIDLLRRGYLTAVAMNGSAMIHDFEVGLVGSTSEDVPAVLGRGRFGMAEETGRYINEAIAAGDQEGLGIGEAVGRFLTRGREARYRRYSLLAAVYEHRVPATVHEAIGTDIIHNHPAVDARALGAATHRDFLLLAALVKEMDGGGVYLNAGSAVVLPEVFLKCVSLAANLGRAPRGITTVNLDFIQHYRPTQNVLLRPTAVGAKKTAPSASHGYALTGHHELMIPLLAAALKRQ